MRRLEEQWTLSDRYQRPLSVVILDIDHFKRVNDMHGHSAGDLVLREVAKTLGACVRNTDTVCRIGGEEFLIILPFQTTVEAELCANRCRTEVADREFSYLGQILKTTVSAGIGCRRGDMVCCSDLLDEADTALYVAKRAGRNIVHSGRALPETTPPADNFAA